MSDRRRLHADCDPDRCLVGDDSPCLLFEEEDPCCLLYKMHYPQDHEFDCPVRVRSETVTAFRCVATAPLHGWGAVQGDEMIQCVLPDAHEGGHEFDRPVLQQHSLDEEVAAAIASIQGGQK